MSASISAHRGDLPLAPHVEATGRALGVATWCFGFLSLVETEARGAHVASFNLPQAFAFSVLSFHGCLSVASNQVLCFHLGALLRPNSTGALRDGWLFGGFEAVSFDSLLLLAAALASLGSRGTQAALSLLLPFGHTRDSTWFS